MAALRPLQSDVYPRTLDCIHCGLCLSACPTYRVTGRESASPRGRVYLMRGVAEGQIELGAGVAAELDLCLGCRACESACPSGVEYGAMLEGAREAVARAGLRRGLAPRIARLALRHVLPRRRRLHGLLSLLAVVQRLRLDRLVSPLLPSALRRARRLLPAVPALAERRPLPAFTAARGERRGRVALFEGCIASQLFGSVNRATLRVLSCNGFDVVVPRRQTCCGALQAHQGDLSLARDLARENIAAFSGGDAEAVDAVVTNSAGCGAVLREVERWLPGEGTGFAARVRDVCEFLDEVGLRPPPHRIDARVCYDDPCHLVHAQRVSAAPRRLLARVDGLELVGHADAEVCCGAAGIYNLTQRDMSQRVLEPKLAALEAAGPDFVASGNPGCLIQLQAGLDERELSIRALHPIELLARAYR